MQKLAPAEEAKVLMNEAKDWSVWHWLTEKKRVRTVADAAVDAYDAYETKVKADWSDGLKKAYRELVALAELDGNPRTRRQYEEAQEEAQDIDPQMKLVVQRIWEADCTAYDARMKAEETFAEAERRMSASMARQGSLDALESYELREKAIRRAEAAMRPR